jgi:hypothetical protein
VDAGAELTLILRNGAQFRGFALGVEDQTWALRLATRPGDCLYAPQAEVTGLIIHEPAVPVRYTWAAEHPTAIESATAAAYRESILAARLDSLKAVHLVSGEHCRLRFEEGTLVAEFVPGTSAPLPNEIGALAS